MTPHTTFYNEYIELPKLTEKKIISVYSHYNR